MKRTTIVVPCYNEEQRLQVAEFKSFLDLNPKLDLLPRRDFFNLVFHL
jgi:hypothetical protein